MTIVYLIRVLLIKNIMQVIHVKFNQCIINNAGKIYINPKFIHRTEEDNKSLHIVNNKYEWNFCKYLYVENYNAYTNSKKDRREIKEVCHKISKKFFHYLIDILKNSIKPFLVFMCVGIWLVKVAKSYSSLCFLEAFALNASKASVNEDFVP